MSHVSTITIDTDGSPTDTLVSAAFTTSGSNRHVDVFLGQSQSGAGAFAMTSVSRGSETYAHQRTDDNPSESVWAHGSYFMSTTEPQTASAAMTLVSAASEEQWGASITVLDDVDQTTRLRDLGSGVTCALNPDGDGTVAGLAITSAVGDLVVSAIMTSGNTIPTAPVDADVTQTLRGSWTTGSGLAAGLVATAPGATTATLDWNNTQFRFVHYAASHPPAAAPVNTVPVHTLGIYTTSDSASTIASIGPSTAISVVDAAGLTTCRVYCTSGDLTVTLSGSVVISAGANGSSDFTLGSGASTAEFNTVLATLTYQGDADFHGTDTINVVSTGTGGSDTDTFNVLNDPRSITLTATEANFSYLVTAVASTEMRMDADRQSATCTVTATDDDALTDVQIVTLQVAPSQSVFPYRNLAVPTARRDRR